ncbi:MAG: hypothetical protein M1818_004350 [Claussenomyces sp. TS43310]|nr:MAG: hypothetical protein M1818_004350 [Claussenomyces sp. TS43310]
MENETRAYRTFNEYKEVEVPAVAPALLAHVAENGCVIGILLEKLDGVFASMDDLPECEEALRRLYRMDMVHGDVNRYPICPREVFSSSILNMLNNTKSPKRSRSSGLYRLNWQRLQEEEDQLWNSLVPKFLWPGILDVIGVPLGVFCGVLDSTTCWGTAVWEIELIKPDFLITRENAYQMLKLYYSRSPE